MSSTPFKPYWKPVGSPADPYSWVFFVVAHIAGRHRPVAVVSSLGQNLQAETLQGFPLTAACQRIVKIFKDGRNHSTIRAELALANGYYMRDGDREYLHEPVELPELNRIMADKSLREMRPWYYGMQEFPFIVSCLLQGVGFETQEGITRVAQPEPLGTLYRDTSIEWGMVVVDITQLDSVRYGIVGFGVGPMKWLHQSGMRVIQWEPWVQAPLREANKGYSIPCGPRIPMSAVQYLAKFKEHHETLSLYDDDARQNHLHQLASIPLIDAAAMELVWPQSDDILLPLASLSIDNSKIATERSMQGRAIANIIESNLKTDELDMSIFNEFRTVPTFQDIFRRYLVHYSSQLGVTRSASQLIQLAFAGQEHLGLEELNNLSTEAISGVLGMLGMEKVISISICIDSIRDTPAELVEVLSRADALREICFVQSPTRESDDLSIKVFEELAARPEVLRRAKVVLAGAYSAALRKKFWLPTIPKKSLSNLADVVQVAPLDIFPVQQMLVRKQINSYGPSVFERRYIHLGDALLKPERFASGFLVYLHSLLSSGDDTMNPEAQIFSFSSAPSSLALDSLTSAEITPILTENFAMDYDCWPKMRDLVPSGWTVIVSLEKYLDKAARLRGVRNDTSQFIRYAFVRARQQRVVVNGPHSIPLGPEMLEAVGLKDFLNITAPEVDSDLVDHRLHGIAEELNAGWLQGLLPLSIEPVSVLSQADAADILLSLLGKARSSNDRANE